MADHHDQQLVQKRDVIQKNPLEAPPEYSTELPDLSVLRLGSPCAKSGFSGAGNGNSHKRQRPFSINYQQPVPKKLFVDDSTTTTAYPLLRRCVPNPFHLPSPAQPAPESSPAQPPPESSPAVASGVLSNASPKSARNPESATPCSAKGSVPPTGSNALPPRPPPLRRCCNSSENSSKKLKKIRKYWIEMKMLIKEFIGVDQTEGGVVEEGKEELDINTDKNTPIFLRNNRKSKLEKSELTSYGPSFRSGEDLSKEGFGLKMGGLREEENWIGLRDKGIMIVGTLTFEMVKKMTGELCQCRLLLLLPRVS
ncbi:hypothetical protein L484_015327 [Morus notabilis]|uniref:Uncharacterized protein n=1 Tax=Morus notabilis TaxID=981085 RepID=W9RC03_9ROSA|nr:hypothetical protein L484_015327 [Morus notabilis]